MCGQRRNAVAANGPANRPHIGPTPRKGSRRVEDPQIGLPLPPGPARRGRPREADPERVAVRPHVGDPGRFRFDMDLNLHSQLVIAITQ